MKWLSALAVVVLLGVKALAQPAAPLPSSDERIAKWVESHTGEIVALYEQLHQAPELSHAEQATAARMAQELTQLGMDVQTNIGGHGVVGVLKNGPGKTLMLRADMDALPVAEETNLPYASRVRTKNERGQTVGVMHACGHDIHMSNLIGVARLLSAERESWSGTLVCLFQPAEERGQGAGRMLDDGLLTRVPRPDFAVALHVAADYPTGHTGYLAGYSQANVDSVDITIRGRGGHGAYPETTIDPIVIAAKLVLDLQTIVSREIKPQAPAVITVGAIEGGTKHNVIPDTCHLQLTVRSYAPAVREQLATAIRRKAQAAALSAGAPEPEVRISEGTPSLYNDPVLTGRVAASMHRILGADRVAESEASMGGEDFSRYGLAGIPICMFKLGSVSAERLATFERESTPPPSLHSAQYYPDPEATLRTGITSMSAVAIDLLAK